MWNKAIEIFNKQRYTYICLKGLHSENSVTIPLKEISSILNIILNAYY